MDESDFLTAVACMRDLLMRSGADNSSAEVRDRHLEVALCG